MTRHVVITGGGTGVGAELARRFARDGAAVTILGRRMGPLHDIAKETGALPLTADVTDRASLDAALSQARATHGPVAVAIANAGAAASAPFSRTTPEDLRAIMAVNVEGVFHLWQATLPDMKQAGWGRMIAVASIAGLKGFAYVAPYCAAKHAVIGMTRALACELATTGITVNAICPGYIETPLLDRAIGAITDKTGISAKAAAQSLLAGNPQKRFIQTGEVADAAHWLCSDGAASVNGHALSLSGGEV